jgi:hypothetical protein
LIKHEFMVDYRCWNNHGEEGLNEAEMRDSYLEREVPTGVEEDQDNDVNKSDILGFTNDDIEFQVHNIEEMVQMSRDMVTMISTVMVSLQSTRR